MALQQPFGHIRIPDRERGGNELTGYDRRPARRWRRAGGAPPRQPQTQGQQCLDDDAAVEHPRSDGDREVLRQRTGGGLGQAERRI